MPDVPLAGIPVLLAAGREEALRPLLVQLIVIILAARMLRGGRHEATLVARGFLRG